MVFTHSGGQVYVLKHLHRSHTAVREAVCGYVVDSVITASIVSPFGRALTVALERVQQFQALLVCELSEERSTLVFVLSANWADTSAKKRPQFGIEVTENEDTQGLAMFC